MRTRSSQSGTLNHQQSGTVMRGWCPSRLCGHDLGWTSAPGSWKRSQRMQTERPSLTHPPGNCVRFLRSLKDAQHRAQRSSLKPGLLKIFWTPIPHHAFFAANCLLQLGRSLPQSRRGPGGSGPSRTPRHSGCESLPPTTASQDSD